MWALVKSGSIDTIYGGARAITIGDIKYPKGMFTLYSTAEKKSIGIYDIVRKDQPDHNFYDVSDSTFIYDAGDDVVNENFDTTEKDIALIKIDWKKGVTRVAFRLITSYAWLAERYVFDNTKAIPDAVKSYIASVRTHCDTICAAADNCSDVDGLKAVMADVGAWPDNSSVKSYVRRY